MIQKRIIFVPGKNPKPMPEQHKAVLWRTLVEGVQRAEPEIIKQFTSAQTHFELAAWNHAYYRQYKDMARDLPWIDHLINTHGPSEQDIKEANSWHKKFDRWLYTMGDLFPFLIHLMPKPIRLSLEELDRYFNNQDNIACEVREQLKVLLRNPLQLGEDILLIGHSMGSVIAYDTLWELSNIESHPGKLTLLTIGSPLGMRYIQKRLLGNQQPLKSRYPKNIHRWHNLSAEGDYVALDKAVHDDYIEMLKLGQIESIEDHCAGIYNYFHNEEGLNCHRSYGYLVNPAVGELIAQWWKSDG